MSLGTAGLWHSCGLPRHGLQTSCRKSAEKYRLGFSRRKKNKKLHNTTLVTNTRPDKIHGLEIYKKKRERQTEEKIKVRTNTHHIVQYTLNTDDIW